MDIADFVCDSEVIEKLVEEIRERISDFISEVKMEQYVDAKSDGKNNVLLYGASINGPMIMKELADEGLIIPYIIDDDDTKWGGYQDDIEIVSRNDARVQKYHHVIVACSSVREIMDTYEKSECEIISYSQYHLCKHYDEYIDVRDNFFTDEKSKQVFNLAMHDQLTSGFDGEMWRVCEGNQYFAIPQFDFLRKEYIVDAGAYVGDTLEQFLWHTISVFGHYWAFEPATKQFEALEKRVLRICDEWALDREIFTLVQAGVGARDGKIIADSCVLGDNTEFRMDPRKINPDFDGDGTAIYSLDSFLEGEKVTLIKADIEGMEMNLLEGAKEIIKVQKPKLAICVYHHPCDLYCIAKRIREINPDYRFVLRSHSKHYGELVLYCF